MQDWLLGAGVAAPVVYLAGVLAAGAAYPGYSHRRQLLGELGAADSAGAGWFNTALVLAGLLVVAFAFGLRAATGAFWPSLGVALFGAMTVLMGRYRSEPGGALQPHTRAARLHGQAGVVATVAVIAAALALAWTAWHHRGWGPLAAFSLAAAFAAVALVAALAMLEDSRWGGLVQRLLVGVVFVWILGVAGFLLA